MVKRSVRRKPVTAADLTSARKQSRNKKAKSPTRAARERFVTRAKKRGLMKRVAAMAQAALPAAPTKLQQLEARVRAGQADDPLADCAGAPAAMPVPDDGAARETGLTARVRALYEDGLVPVRELARLCGVTERTLYKYAARGRWRKRYARRALAKGTGGRFVPRAEAETEAGVAKASGLKALDPLAAGQALAACAQAEAIAHRAAARALAGHKAREDREAVLREFETRARRLALLTRSLRWLVAAPGRGEARVRCGVRRP